MEVNFNFIKNTKITKIKRHYKMNNEFTMSLTGGFGSTS